MGVLGAFHAGDLRCEVTKFVGVYWCEITQSLWYIGERSHYILAYVPVHYTGTFR